MRDTLANLLKMHRVSILRNNKKFRIEQYGLK